MFKSRCFGFFMGILFLGQPLALCCMQDWYQESAGLSTDGEIMAPWTPGQVEALPSTDLEGGAEELTSLARGYREGSPDRTEDPARTPIFVQQKEVARQEKSEEEKVEVFQGEHSSVVYLVPQGLAIRKSRMVHGQVWRCFYPECPYVTETQKGVDKHIEGHTGLKVAALRRQEDRASRAFARVYSCIFPECPFRTRSVRSLETHMRKHEGEYRPFCSSGSFYTYQLTVPKRNVHKK